MKISNYQRMRFFMYLICTLMIISTVVGIIIFLLINPAKEIYFLIIALILVLLGIVFFRLRAIIYDDSGEVVTIKSYHPLENKIYCPTLEFPTSQLKDYAVSKKLQGYNITITLESFRRKETKKKFLLTGFGKKQRTNLISSLENMKQMNLNL